MCLIRQAKKVLVADFTGAKVILNLETYLPYILNRTAGEIWDFLNKPRKSKEIIDFLQKRYKISLKEAKRDAGKFIRGLEKKGLIEKV